LWFGLDWVNGSKTRSRATNARARELRRDPRRPHRPGARAVVLPRVEHGLAGAGVTHATAQYLMIRGLINRAGGAGAFVLTDQGRAVLAALLHWDC